MHRWKEQPLYIQTLYTSSQTLHARTWHAERKCPRQHQRPRQHQLPRQHQRPRRHQQPQSSWWVLILVLRTLYDPSAESTGLTHLFSFTSVAFAHSDSPEEVKLVETWPNGGTSGRTAYQVPTEVYYTNPQTRCKLWGYELSTISYGAMSPDPLKWFKLLLQEKNTPTLSQTPALFRGSQVHKKYPERGPANLSALFQSLGVSSAGLSSSLVSPAVTPAQETAQKLRQLKITPLEVVTDFLESVRELAVSEIGTSYQTKWVQGQKIEYVLTVPGKLNCQSY